MADSRRDRHVGARPQARRARAPEGPPVDPRRAGGGARAARRCAAPARSADRAPARIQDRYGCICGRAPGRARRRDEDGDGRGLRSGDVLSPLRRRSRRARRRRRRSRCASARRCPARWPGARAAARRRRGARAPRRARLHAPCVGRCEHAPAAVVGPQSGRRRDASRRSRRRDRKPGATEAAADAVRRLRRISRRRAATRRCVDASSGTRSVDDVIAAMEDSGLARPRRRGFSGRPQMENRARRARAAPDGDQHRRGRARHLQGSLLPRARSAPLSRRRADRGLGGRHRRRSTSTCATSITAAARFSSARSRRCRRIRRARFRRSICAAAPAPTSAAKNPR